MGRSLEFQTTGRNLAPLQAFGPLDPRRRCSSPKVSGICQKVKHFRVYSNRE